SPIYYPYIFDYLFVQKGDSMDSWTWMNAVFYFYNYLLFFIVFCIVVFFSISLWILGFSLVFNDFPGFLLSIKNTCEIVGNSGFWSRDQTTKHKNFEIYEFWSRDQTTKHKNFEIYKFWSRDQTTRHKNFKIYKFWSGDQTTKHKNFEIYKFWSRDQTTEHKSSNIYKFWSRDQTTKHKNFKMYKLRSRDQTTKHKNSKIYKFWPRDQTTKHKNCNLDPSTAFYIESRFNILLN
uniref:Uncharacterized protein n=1 Tax=Strongyloides stercoralis TaxID=6248 RepID=A0AAF5CZT7_STRER